MISKINQTTPILTKIAQKPKKAAAAAAAGAGTLAVLSTRQAWPYCDGLEAPKPIEDPENYELRWVNGIQTYVRKDIPVDVCPKVNVEDAQMPIEMSDAMTEANKLHGISGFVDNVATHIHDGVTNIGEKISDAWDNVKDFFEGLGH